MSDEQIFFRQMGELNIAAEVDNLRNNTYFVEHRLTNAELHHEEGRAVFMLREQASRQIADHIIRTGKMKFYEVADRSVGRDGFRRDDGGRVFRGRLTSMHSEDVDRLEAFLRKLADVYGPRVILP